MFVNQQRFCFSVVTPTRRHLSGSYQTVRPEPCQQLASAPHYIHRTLLQESLQSTIFSSIYQHMLVVVPFCMNSWCLLWPFTLKHKVIRKSGASPRSTSVSYTCIPPPPIGKLPDNQPLPLALVTDRLLPIIFYRQETATQFTVETSVLSLQHRKAANWLSKSSCLSPV